MTNNNSNLTESLPSINWKACFLLLLVVFTLTGICERLVDPTEGNWIELTIDQEKEADSENKKTGQDAEIDDYVHSYINSCLYFSQIDANLLGAPSWLDNIFLEYPDPPPEQG